MGAFATVDDLQSQDIFVEANGVLREMEEMETGQICEALNISPNNLWVMLHRARMALRECLEINWFKGQSPEASI